MSLSQDIVEQFVKTMTEKDKTRKEAIVNGTYKKIGDKEYVQIDGSDILTPVESTVEAEDGERVQVQIKDHNATVTGNITSPAARSKSVQNLKDEVDEFGNTIQQLDNSITQQGNSIIQIENNIKQVENDILQANNQINQQNNTITQLGNDINEQNDKIDSMNNTITQHGNDIESMNNTIEQHNNRIEQNENDIEQQNNTIEQFGNDIKEYGNRIDSVENQITEQGDSITSLNNRVDSQDNIISQHGDQITSMDNRIVQQGNDITILNSAFTIIDGKLVGLDEIIINELKSQHLDSAYATIDFANINMAAVEKLFTNSGIIGDLVVKEGKITGTLVGVTIIGDSIQAGTLKADRLVVKGEDGLYYKLNIDGLNNISTDQASKFISLTEKPEDWDTNYADYYTIVDGKYIHLTGLEAPQWSSGTYYRLSSTYEDALDGSNIVAKSITADKVTVNDLVAFDATIGGFDITDHSIHSHGKDNVNSVGEGMYMDDSGQMNLGDDNQYIKYFKDKDGKWKLMIKIDEIYTSSSSKSISDQIKELQNTVKDVEKAVKEVDVEYALSNSSTESPIEDDWSTIAPEWEENKYMWQRTKITYVDGTIETSEPTCIQGAKGQNGKDGQQGPKGDPGEDGKDGKDGAQGEQGPPGEPGKDGEKGEPGEKGDPGKNGTSITIKSTSIEYKASTNGTTKPTSGWSSTIPSVNNGEYLWTKTIVNYSDGTSTTSYSVSYNGTNGTNGKDGQQGPKGDPGEDGAPGKDGVNGTNGTSSYTHIKYATKADGSDMSNDPTSKTYIGIYTGTSKNAPTTNTSYTWSLFKGADGKNGTNGTNGKAGNGITSISYFYKTTSNQTAPQPSEITSTTIPTMSTTNKYLWQKEVIDFSDTSVEDKTTVLLIAVYGDKGDKGNTGDKGETGDKGDTGVGVKSITELYYLKNSNTATPAAPTAHVTSTSTAANIWTTKCPVYQKGYYYWVCSEILYTDNTYKWTTVTLANGINNANEKVENLELGTRNLLLKSNEQYTNELYNIAKYYLTQKIIKDEDYTITIWGNLGEGKTAFMAYLNGSSIRLSRKYT